MTAFQEVAPRERRKVIEFLVSRGKSSRFRRGADARMRDFSLIERGLQNVSKTKSECIDDHVLVNRILVQFRIGSESVNGEVDKSCYPILCQHSPSAHGSSTHSRTCRCQNSSLNLALKKAPLMGHIPQIDPARQDITQPEWTQYDVYAEIVCLELVTALVKARVCPNLPMFFSYYVCAKCEFENKEIQKYYGSSVGSCVLSLSEFANGGDLKHWCETSRSFDEWMNAYFQIFMGIVAIQKYFNMVHFDLHWGNVLIHNVPKGGYWEYTLDGRKYYLPNVGFLFTLWDFGYAFIPGKLVIDSAVRIKRNREAIENGTMYLSDYQQISGAVSWALTSNTKKVTVPIQLQTEFTRLVDEDWPLRVLMTILFGPGGYYDLSQKPSGSGGGKLLHSFSLDTPISKIKIDPRYRKFFASDVVNSLG